MIGSGKASGCLFGLAIGDALAAPTEFMDVAVIVRRFGPDGPSAPSAKVTDDTQMALCVGEVLLAVPRPTATTLEPVLRRAFVDWSVSPENDRAPGNTCLQACAKLSDGRPWVAATVAGSKGCGANMRVPPVALCGFNPATRAAVAQFQAAMTHGHPTALAAADLTAFAVADLAAGGDADGLPDRLVGYARAQRDVYHGDWLGDLWQRPGLTSPPEFIRRGWDECTAVLHRLVAALRQPDRSADPCAATGDGWIAEEAMATGLLCFLMCPGDAVAAVRRAAVTRGDSDSIACLTGAFAGAHLGLAAWPAEWVEKVEYHDRLARLGAAWD